MVSEDDHDHGKERNESEEEREMDKERKNKSKRSSRNQSRDMKRSRERKRSHSRERSRDRNGERDRSRDRSGERDRSRDRSGERDRSRDRSGERDRSRDRNGERDRSRDRSGEQTPKRHKTKVSPSLESSSSSRAENMRRGLQQVQSSKSPGNPSESDFESPIKQLQVIGSKTKKQKLGPYEALARARWELKRGDIHQAGEKGWLAVDIALNEVASSVRYSIDKLKSHRGKSTFASHLEDKFNNPKIHQLFCVASAMYSSSYDDNTSEEAVEEDLKEIKELLTILDSIKRSHQ